MRTFCRVEPQAAAKHTPPQSEPFQISVQVETRVEVTDEGEYSHGSPSYSSLVSSPQLYLPSSSPNRFTALIDHMSLPRGNYDPRRVCLNPFPEITLGRHRRAMGVYLAGALVCFFFALNELDTLH